MIGISPGTRSVGIALIRDGTLIDFGLKMFREEWSDEKLDKILKVLEAYITSYKVSSIAIKSSHNSRTSEGLDELLKGIVTLTKQINLPCRWYTIDELKYYCNGSRSKQALMSYVFQQYPEVEKSTRLTSDNMNYHLKTIEAVALAHVMNQ